MSADDAREAARLLRGQGVEAKVRRLPGVGDGYQVLVRNGRGDSAKCTKLSQVQRLLDRWC